MYLILSLQGRGTAGLLIPCTNRPDCLPKSQQGFWQWFRPLRRGGATATPLLGKLFQNRTVFHQNWVYTPNFGPNIRIFLRFAPTCVKYLKFAPLFSKVCILALSLTIKMYLQCLAYTRALQRETSISPLFDWCINYPFTWSTSSPLINEHQTWQLYQVCLFVRD